MSRSYAINKTKYLSEPEVKALERTLEKYQEQDLRNVLMIWTALKTGARASELLDLKKSDLNEQDQTVFIRGLKNSKDGEIPVSQDLFTLLLNYSRTVKGEYLFPISYQRLDQIWKTYRPVAKSFHSLRHSFAIGILTRTKDIKLVQTALRHKSLLSSQVYLDYVFAKEELRRIL